MMIRGAQRIARVPLMGAFSTRALSTATVVRSRGFYGSNDSNRRHQMGFLGFTLGASLLATYAVSASDRKIEAASHSPRFSKKDTTVVFILGGPGAGKGTQCAKLVKEFGFVHLSAGDLLRDERNNPGSQYGELIHTCIKEGKIVPMEITISLLEKAMAEEKKKGNHRFLVDGFPRMIDQGQKFEETVCESQFVLFFDCPEAEMEKRLLKRGESSGRVDDNIESIRKRFTTFIDATMPVIDYYGKQNKVKTVSCLNSVDSVYADVRQVFLEIFKDKAKK